VSASNSLVGTVQDNPNAGVTGDRIGSGGIIELFPSGNYLVASPTWNNPATSAQNAGAITWVDGTSGKAFGQALPGAIVSAGNSLVGQPAGDQVGRLNCDCSSPPVFPVGNNNVALLTSSWTNPTNGATNAGAVTVIDGATGIAGPISSSNSLI